MPRYVQYGCGLTAPTQWENYDASPTLKIQKMPLIGKILSSLLRKKGFAAFPDNVSFGDITVGLPVEENTCDAVYCSHTLEHLALEDFRNALKNSHKILKKGGTFRFVLPDLAWAARKYINDFDKGKTDASIWFMTETLLGEENRPEGFFKTIANSFGNSNHLWMWDSASMKEELRKAGFTEIRDCKFGDNTDEMFGFVENIERFQNAVAIECKK
jgi:SAM-dependent methyltransferase